jgi:hypothetical protein
VPGDQDSLHARRVLAKINFSTACELPDRH